MPSDTSAFPKLWFAAQYQSARKYLLTSMLAVLIQLLPITIQKLNSLPIFSNFHIINFYTITQVNNSKNIICKNIYDVIQKQPPLIKNSPSVHCFRSSVVRYVLEYFLASLLMRRIKIKWKCLFGIQQRVRYSQTVLGKR